MTFHDLKCWPDFWRPMTLGEKTFDIRKDDRGFAVGDVLVLRWWDPQRESYETPSGLLLNPLLFQVAFCLREQPWVPEGYVAMGLRRVYLQLSDAPACREPQCE